jgi:PilZ domain
MLSDGTVDGTRVPAQVIDVSAEGVALRCSHELVENSDLVLDFSSRHDPEPVRVTAILRNRRGDTYGVQFQPRSEQECKSLDRIDGLLLASGFQIEYRSSKSQSVRLQGVVALAAGLAFGGFLGGSLQNTVLGIGIGGVIGLTVAFAAYTL